MAGEIESTTPESVDVAGAVALMGDLVKDVSEEEKGERDADTAADGGDGDDGLLPKPTRRRAKARSPKRSPKTRCRPRAATHRNSGAPRTRPPGMPCRPGCGQC